MGQVLVISRAEFKELWNKGCGSENAKSGDLELHIQFRPYDEEGPGGRRSGNEPKLLARCGEFDLTVHINAWESLPPLKPLPDVNPGTHHA